MTEINEIVETKMLGFIKRNLTNLVKPEGHGPVNLGICEYNLATHFGDLSANEIRDYLVDLEKKGELRLVDERQVRKGIQPLRFYLPVEDR